MKIRPFSMADEPAVVELWRRCELTRPWNDPHRDIQRKLTTQADLFLVGEVDGEIVASVMAGFDGHRGWVNYLAVSPEHRQAGLGRTLMRHAESELKKRGCPKLNLQVRAANRSALEFYKRIGYSTDEVISLGKRLVTDES